MQCLISIIKNKVLHLSVSISVYYSIYIVYNLNTYIILYTLENTNYSIFLLLLLSVYLNIIIN